MAGPLGSLMVPGFCLRISSSLSRFLMWLQLSTSSDLDSMPDSEKTKSRKVVWPVPLPFWASISSSVKGSKEERKG